MASQVLLCAVAASVRRVFPRFAATSFWSGDVSQAPLASNTAEMRQAIIADAGQKYGLVVWDFGDAIGCHAENVGGLRAAGIPNPYPALCQGQQYDDVLDGFGWDHVQALPVDYDKR